MAISGNANWNMNRDAIVNAAFRKIGVSVDGATATPTQLINAQEALNNIVFSLYAQGMPVWAMTTTSFTMTAGQAAYPVGLGIGTGNLNVQAPLKITQGWIRDSSGTDVPLNIYTQYNYNLLATKINQGRTVHLWYQPLNQAGMITLWPTPDSLTASEYTIFFVYQRAFDEFDASTDTPDFPQVWLEPLIYSLAHRMSPEFGMPLAEQDKLNETAQALISNALSFGTEEGSIYLQPDWVGMGWGGK